MPEPDELWKDVTRTPARLRSAPRRKRSSGILAAALVVGCILLASGGLIDWQMQSARQAEPVAAAPRPSLPEPQDALPQTKNEPPRPAGDPATALAVLDELDRWFDVDALALKSKALGAALAGRVTSKSALLAATVALELSAEAERAGRDELALTLSNTAYAAARKARESELIKRAYRRRSELSKGDK